MTCRSQCVQLTYISSGSGSHVRFHGGHDACDMQSSTRSNTSETRNYEMCNMKTRQDFEVSKFIFRCASQRPKCVPNPLQAMSDLCSSTTGDDVCCYQAHTCKQAIAPRSILKHQFACRHTCKRRELDYAYIYIMYIDIMLWTILYHRGEPWLGHHAFITLRCIKALAFNTVSPVICFLYSFVMIEKATSRFWGDDWDRANQHNMSHVAFPAAIYISLSPHPTVRCSPKCQTDTHWCAPSQLWCPRVHGVQMSMGSN